MEIFEATAQEWGNSIGITIPKEIVKKNKISAKKKIRVLLLNNTKGEIKKSFGTLHLKRSTQEVMDEIDEGYD